MACEVSFEVTADERELIQAIAQRASGLLNGFDNLQETEMDVTAVHANGCPLDLAKLLTFNVSNFVHDIMGIFTHLNRQTGQLEGHFLPRAYQPEAQHEKATT